MDALEIDRQRLGQRLDREGLGEARHAFDQHMAAGEEAHQQAVEQVVLPDDHPAQLGFDALQGQSFAFYVSVQCGDIEFHGHSWLESRAARGVPRAAPRKYPKNTRDLRRLGRADRSLSGVSASQNGTRREGSDTVRSCANPHCGNP